jgi:flagellar basal body-associated protein FliL
MQKRYFPMRSLFLDLAPARSGNELVVIAAVVIIVIAVAVILAVAVGVFVFVRMRQSQPSTRALDASWESGKSDSSSKAGRETS